jgi:hypothetical protein
MKNILTFLLASNISILAFTQYQNRILIVSKLNTRPVIDGNTSEWSGNWHDIKWPYGGSITFDMTAKFQVGCTADTLYFAFEVNDSTPGNNLIENPWWNDGITLKLSMDSTMDMFKYGQYSFTYSRGNSYFGTPSESIKKAIKTKAAGNDKKYWMEWAVPYNVIDSYTATPENGDKIAFNTLVTDNTGDTADGYYGLTQRNYWYPDGDMQSGFIFCGYLQLEFDGTSINSKASKNRIVYLNSANEIILNKKYLNISIFDITGRELIKAKKLGKISIVYLPEGVYLVNLNRTETVKIIKK